MSVTVNHGGHQGEHIRTAISEREERNTSNAGRNTHFFHHISEGNTEVAISRGSQNINDEYKDQQPTERENKFLPTHCDAVLEIQVVKEPSLVRASHFFTVVFLLCFILYMDSDHNVVSTRVIPYIIVEGIV